MHLAAHFAEHGLSMTFFMLMYTGEDYDLLTDHAATDGFLRTFEGYVIWVSILIVTLAMTFFLLVGRTTTRLSINAVSSVKVFPVLHLRRSDHWAQ